MIQPALEKAGKRARLIGLMVVGYGDLELTFMNCAGVVVNRRWEVLDAVHKVRSENSRIEIADALARKWYAALGLTVEYKAALDGLRHCLRIRNLYAHSQYQLVRNRLEFVSAEGSFEDISKPTPWKRITLPLLQEQAAYFSCTREMLVWIELSLPRLMAGKPSAYAVPKPPKMPPVTLDRLQSRRRARTHKH